MTSEQLAALVAPYEAQVRALVAENFNLRTALAEVQARATAAPAPEQEA